MRPSALLAEERKIEAATQAAARLAYARSNGREDRHDVADRDSGPKQPTLNREALYGVVGDIVRIIEPHTEADSSAILIQLLAGFGNMIGATPHFRVEGDRHRAILFVATVGDTAKARKGVASGHVRRVLNRIDESWMVYNGLSSGEGLIHAVRDPQTKKEPIKQNGKVIDYQDVIADDGVSDKRALVLEPEFASVLRVADRDGNTLSAIIRQAWDTGDLRVMTRNNPVASTGAHISIVGHITREELTRTLSQTEKANGFANRFCWLWVQRSKYLPDGGALHESDLNAAVAQLRIAFEFARAAGEVRRDQEAAELWRSKYVQLSSAHPGMLGAITSRAEAQVVRLSLIYALLDCSALIRRPHLEAALALWQYCEDSARFIFGDAIGDRLADEILLALRDASDIGMTRSQISQLFKRNVDADRLNSALQCLSRNGLAESRKEATDGRPIERWFAVERIELRESEEIVFEAEING